MKFTGKTPENPAAALKAKANRVAGKSNASRYADMGTPPTTPGKPSRKLLPGMRKAGC